MQIGKKIKQLRQERKMTLTELSKQSDVQLATLSRIENLKMTGTLVSHMSIAKALAVNITDLYGDIDLAEKKVDVRNSKSEIADVFVHSDKSSYEILTGKVLTKRMMPILLKIDPEGKTNKEQGPVGSEKFIFVLEGKANIIIDKDTYPLSKANSLYFDASLPHVLVNTGKSVARIICVTTPVTL